ncbi:hypothetical protein POM88_043156 [Heracleum sosnowskyi]|uniref:Uncharacterized protein n=1 Tax=Heracleum sosnowskyi TaxID=360622 RepID=A0AAD8M411_9APIA|nr:hypothetical protein POM88_043156 [Heracleum sosnowskyi]
MTETLFPKSSKRKIDELVQAILPSKKFDVEDKLLWNDVDECFLEEEEDKLLKNDVGECFVEQDDEAKESDTVNLSNLPFEEDKLSRNAVGECFVEQDDEAKESEFGDTDLPFEEDDLEDDEAFIQFGDTDDLSHLLLGVVEDKSSLVGKCFQEEIKCFQEDDEAKETFIQIGDKVDLSDLLFTKYRDYLITCSHQDIEKPVKVKAKDLAGKFILLHFMYLTDYFDTWSWQAPIANLEDLYTKLHPNGDFEIVFVALRDDHAIPSTTRQHLQHIFLMMPPCPAIPLSDRKSIQRLERMFGIQNARHFSPTSFIIDPTGEQVPLHNLDDKVVRLFFYCYSFLISNCYSSSNLLCYPISGSIDILANQDLASFVFNLMQFQKIRWGDAVHETILYLTGLRLPDKMAWDKKRSLVESRVKIYSMGVYFGFKHE